MLILKQIVQQPSLTTFFLDLSPPLNLLYAHTCYSIEVQTALTVLNLFPKGSSYVLLSSGRRVTES